MPFKSPFLWLSIAALLFSSYSTAQEAEFIFVKQNSSPKYLDASVAGEGLCDRIYSQLRFQLQESGVKAKIDPNHYPIKRVLAMLEQGSAHVFCGAGRNAEREEQFHYSKLPVYAVSNVVLTHQSNKYVAQSYQDLQNEKLTIGAFFGTSSARFLKQFEGIKVVDTFKTLDDAMLAIAKRQIPYFYYHDLGLVYLVENTNLPIKLMPTKFRTVDQWMIYSPHLHQEQVEVLDEALHTLTNHGVIADINARFFQK